MNTEALLDQPSCRADDAERCLLGQCMTWPRPCLDVTAEHVGPEDFFNPAHQRLFGIILALDDETGGRGFDPVMVEAALKREGALESVGGREALIALANEAANQETAEFHARQVREASLGRQVQDMAQDVLRATAAKDFKAERVIGAWAKRLAKLDTAAGPRTGGVLVNLGDVEARPVLWLWPGRIALGKVALVAGDPSLGKSLITLDMAARVSSGTTWPDNAANAGVGGVVVLTAEDDLGDTVVPRLQAAGADRGRVRALTAVNVGERTRTFDLGRDVEVLAEAIHATPECRLVIVDPITAYLPGKDGNSNVEIRSVLAPLAALAAESGVAVVGVTHLRKGDGAPLYRIMGSLGFVAAARAVWAACKDQSDPTGRRRFLLPCKNNLAPDGGGLAYRIESLDGQTVPVVTWEPEPVNVRLEDVLPTQGQPGPDPEAQREAEDFLRQALADGPRPAADVIREGADLGISRRTLYRAKARVGQSERVGGVADRGAWLWRLG